MNRQSHSPQAKYNSPTHGADKQYPTYYSIKQPDTPANTSKDVRFFSPPGVPFRNLLQNPSRQQEPQQVDKQNRYASLSNVEAVEAVFAALPNENSFKADPNLSDLMRSLTDSERDTARETYFQITPSAERICQTARLDGTARHLYTSQWYSPRLRSQHA